MKNTGKNPSNSDVETTHLILPVDTNHFGTAFGGRIMEWMDIAAGISANRHCRLPCVTVSVDQLSFKVPIQLSDIVIIKARVNYVGNSSMEVGVKVYKENPLGGEREHCLTGYFTFVALKDGKPITIPKLQPQTEDDIRRYNEAELRRKLRLENK